MTPVPTSAMVATALTMAIDQVTCEVADALAQRNIEVILLKGPSIARWLYPEGGRVYGDSDLLVRQADFGRAGDILRSLGFQRALRGQVGHAHTYVRLGAASPTNQTVDLHRTLPYLRAAPEEVWHVLSTGTQTLALRREIAVLGVPCRAMHIAIHARQHAFESEEPFEDLRRALAVVTLDEWKDATLLSRRLGAEDAFAAGLCLVPEGAELARQLELTADRRGTLQVATSPFLDGATYHVQRLADATSTRERLQLLWDYLTVSSTTLRHSSPLARRGPAGLLLVRIGRPFKLLGKLGPAMANRRRIFKKP